MFGSVGEDHSKKGRMISKILSITDSAILPSTYRGKLFDYNIEDLKHSQMAMLMVIIDVFL